MAEQKTMQIDLPMEAIHAFCQRWNIVEFALFGSVLRDDFNDSSDIDVLVQFREGARMTLFSLARLTAELETLFGRSVDVLTRKSVEQSPNYMRRKIILDSAEVIYAE